MWVDVSPSLWRRNERCHDLKVLVLCRCFDRLDHRVVGDGMLLVVGSSVVVVSWPVVVAM
jgi:hypothetical protein